MSADATTLSYDVRVLRMRQILSDAASPLPHNPLKGQQFALQNRFILAFRQRDEHEHHPK
ncbi:hypothetical protein PF005_g29393 [Phytophthora fragariae]|uniref:Uncharacterized protein n=1 Tax=Phytophthora fragariae TaxID=53985 RepID=A0A6A3QCI6_9STRA|nr:hypothetical protein PF009_g29799 [Phytophthora fragariae]KAE8956891.1 hypothetical protein PF011_g31326 [Phytophthora fragariae]KAE9063384.1 hypothetical protein PF010_g29012 [Phytophthora fragariae]KAE9073304.1 hypothetical protein PF006_g28765 [Phytophthora fragariae]KAE9165955.1 hypothetical protein PF005_g29393 [Phytophthora fragariae]